MKKWVDLKKTNVIWVLNFFAIVVYISAAFWPVSPAFKRSFLGVIYMLPPGAATIGTLLVFSRVRDRKRYFWGFLFLAMIALFLGESYWAILQIFQGLNQPPPESFATYAFLSGYAFLFLALFSFWRLSFKKNNWLYGAVTTSILMVTLSGAFWFYQLESVYGVYLRQGKYEELLNGIYPVLDIALLVGFLATAVFSNVSTWAPWITAIVIGIALYAVGDFGFTYFSLADAYEPGTLLSNLLDVFWMACYMFIFYGAYLRLKNTGRRSGERITGA